MKSENSDVEVLSKIEPFSFVPSWYHLANLDHFWMKQRFEFLKEGIERTGLSLNQPLRVLDIGGGNGTVRLQVEAGSQWSVDCADIDEKAVRQLPKGRGKNFVYNVHDVHAKLIGQYDVITLLDVVEHVESPQPFLLAAAKHLKPGGHLIINVPALQALFSKYDEAAGHHRRYSVASLEKDMAGVPLVPCFARYWGFLLVPLLAIRKVMLKRIDGTDAVIKAGFQPSHGWVNSLLSFALTFERIFLPFRPIGSSLIWIGQKNVAES